MKALKNNFYSFLSLGFIAFAMFLSSPSFAQLDGKEISQKYSGAVVKILLWDPVLDQLLVDAGEKAGGGYLGRGSGFIVSPDGYIMTNEHVVADCVYGYVYGKFVENGEVKDWIMKTYYNGLENASTTKAIYYSGRPLPIVQIYTGKGPNDYDLYLAEVKSMGTTYDGALLKITHDIDGNPVSGKSFPTVPIGNSDNTIQGEDICIYGYPAQYQGDMSIAMRDMSTMTFGKHSGLDYVFNEDFGMIKTDADINPGNSGGPAFGENMKVIGIASAHGIQTHIGLLGGINGMYHIVEPVPDAFGKLTRLGLSEPDYSGRKQVVMGSDKPELPETFDENSKKPSGMIAVTGTVKSADTGSPIKDAVVGLLALEGGEYVVVSYAQSDASGAFVMDPPVAPGKYVFGAIADGYEDLEAEVDISDSNKSFSVTLAKSR